MKKRILSAAMALLLMASLPVTALAGTYDLANGSVEVSATESGQSVKQGSNTVPNDPAPIITSNGTLTQNTVTIKADAGQTANVTLSGVNIDVSGTGSSAAAGDAAVSTSGAGSVTIELDGTNTVKSGNLRAGLEKNNTGSLTITDANDDNGSLDATGGAYGAGIGGGYRGNGSDITISGGTTKAVGGLSAAGIGGGGGGSGSSITITDSEVMAEGGDGGAGIGGGLGGDGSNINLSDSDVTATGGICGAGIGGGALGNGSNITVSDDAQVKVQGGTAHEDGLGAGAPIGNGGNYELVDEGTIGPINGAEIKPDVSRLTAKGKIEYYEPGADMSKDAPIEGKTVIGTYEADPQPDPLYRVTDKAGRDTTYKAERRDGVLTVTADEDFAVLTGTLRGVSDLKEQGVEKIIFVTKSAKSTFALAELLEKGSRGEVYKLTHDGKTVTFTLGAKMTDVSGILEKA